MRSPYSQIVSFFLSFLVVALITSASSLADARSFIISNTSDITETFLIVNGSTGYTGIGTDNPSYSLDIVGDIRWSGNLTSGNVSWPSLGSFPTGCGYGQAVQAIGTSLTCVALNSTSGNVSGAGIQNYVAKFTGSGIIGNSIIFDNGTNVGINTTSPKNTLNVVGDINATGNVYGMDGLCIGTDCKTAWSQIESPWDNSSTKTFIRPGYPLYVNISSAIFVNGTSGNVGIGIYDPSDTLHILGTLRSSSSAYLATSSGSVGIGTASQSAKLEIWGSGINGLSFNASDTLFVNATSGQVGIGTSDPVVGLHIGKNVPGGNPRLLMENSNNQNGGLNRWSDRLEILSTDMIQFAIGSSGNNKMTLDNSGNLGMGTAGPSERLNVNGSLRVDNATGSAILFVNSTSGNVGIGTSLPNAKIEVDGGMRLNTTTAKPTCDSAQRGTFWLEQSAGGTDDYMYACMRNSTSDYNWVLVARAG